MAKLKLGILGTGGMAHTHAEGFASIRGVELHACHDPDADRADAFAAKHDIPHTLAKPDAVIDACDAVTIVTHDQAHATLTLAALKAGRHVLCEKPLTTTLADARKVAAAAEAASRRGTIHLTNFTYRNSAALQRAAKLVADGKVGQIRHVTGRYFQSWLTGTHWGPWTNPGFVWRLQQQNKQHFGGALADIGCHALDMLTAIAGDIASARCTTHNFPKIHPKTNKPITEHDGQPLDANDTALIELHLRNGAVGQVETTRWATGRPNQLACGVYGTEGAVEIDLEQGFHVLRTCLGPARDRNEWKTQDLKPTPTNFQRFVRSIKTGRNDQPDLLRGAQVQAYLDACFKSANAKTPGKLTDIPALRP